MRKGLLGASPLTACTIGTLYLLSLNFIYVDICVITTGRILEISCYIFLNAYFSSFIFTKIACIPTYLVPFLGSEVGYPHLSKAQARSFI